MPFAVFRRHQKKLIAVFGILAMIAFLVPAGVTNLLGARSEGTDPEIVKLYGRTVYRSEVDLLRQERARANRFFQQLQYDLRLQMSQFGPNPEFFGPTDTRSIVDALVLQHEAKRLGMPATHEIALSWLKGIAGERWSPTVAALAVSQMARGSQGISEEMILSDVADQLRILKVASLALPAEFTPLDVFESFRDRHEKVGVRAVAFKVDDFVAKVAEPTEVQLREFYDRYRNVPPDPHRPTPGFLIPRRVRVESVSLDSDVLRRQYEGKTTDAELQAAFQERKAELSKTEPFSDKLPVDLFADDPDAHQTPLTLDQVRASLLSDVLETKVQDEMRRRFDAVRDVMSEYTKVYDDATHPPEADDDADDVRDKPTRGITPPSPPDIKALAAKIGLNHDATPLLTRSALATQGEIARATLGSGEGSGDRDLASEVFNPKSDLFTSIDLADRLGHTYLAWKLEDQPARVPELDEIRKEVVSAWKREQARPLAQKAAEALAAEARRHDGDLKAVAGDHPMILSEAPVSRLVENPVPSLYGPATARPSELPQFPEAGDTLRDAIFALGDKSVAVAADQPQSTYYVLALNQRLRAEFRDFTAPNALGERMMLERDAARAAASRRISSWMSDLRRRAGLAADWTPPDESKLQGEDPAEETLPLPGPV